MLGGPEDSTAPAARLGTTRPEDHPIDAGSFLDSPLGPVVIVLAIVLVIVVVALVLVARSLARVRARLDALSAGSDGASLEQVLATSLERVHRVARDLDDVTARTTSLETLGRSAIRNVGLVRYNPFEDTGGNQSFALALLDADGDGVIVSSLHARSGTRIYAKAVVAGRSDSALSDEEAEAIRLAREERRGTAVAS
jgi:hypothetical protein